MEQIKEREVARRAEKEGESAGLAYALNHALAWMTCVALVIVLGRICRERMEPDGIHYLRLASYYNSGHPHLAVSGHWSPLISWLLAPLLATGLDPLVSVRLVIGVGSILFWIGGVFVLSRMGLSKLARGLGAWCLAFTCPSWSVVTITPDLLAAGIICLALGVTFSDGWLRKLGSQWIAGGLWAVAYYAKAVSMPVCLFSCIALGVWRIARDGFPRVLALRGVATTLYSPYSRHLG
jgi:hypothetical protein